MNAGFHQKSRTYFNVLDLCSIIEALNVDAVFLKRLVSLVDMYSLNSGNTLIKQFKQEEAHQNARGSATDQKSL